MPTPTEMAIEAAAKLQGTANSIASLGEEFEDLQLNDEFCAKLDELVFECTCCNWWFEQSEMSENEDWVCIDCANEHNN